MNMILIVLQDDTNKIMISKITSLGATIAFWNSHFLVKTDKSAKEVYDFISENNHDKTSVFVTKIDTNAGDGYWGVMNSVLWKWIKEQSNG